MRSTLACTGSRRGSALLTVMIIVFVVAAGGATMMAFARQQAYSVERVRDHLKAQAYAEAGANEAFSRLKADFSLRHDAGAFQSTDFMDGSYKATVTPVGNDMAVISCVGTYGNASVEVIMDIKNFGPNIPSTPGQEFDASAFDYAILVGGDFTFRGCGDISSADGSGARLHANGVFDVNGDAKTGVDVSSSTLFKAKNQTIDGNTRAPQYSLHSKTVITGTKIQEDVPLVPIPDIDLTPYYNWAAANGEVKNGFSTSASYTPKGGVLWVNGNVKISSHAVINGSIIATGDIDVSGHVCVNPSTTAFCLVSRDGSIKNTSSGTLKGLIYVKTGGYDQTANGAHHGQLIVNGDVKKGGCSDVVLFDKAIPTPPGNTPGTPGLSYDRIGVTAWQK